MKKYKVLILKGQKQYISTRDIAIEETFELIINKIYKVSILATPERLKELTIGFLVCEGVVENASKILDISIEDNMIYATIESNDRFEIWHELRSSGCVGVSWEQNEDITIKSDVIFNKEVILNSLQFLESDIYKKTRGTHAACLVDVNGNLVAKAIDVGRHNAIDKVVGIAILHNINRSEVFLLSSGRQSAGMVLKAARAGIPLIVSKTAPLNTGIESALKTGVCLICFSEKNSFSIFAHPERIYLGIR
ncbi:MAG: formate dehydrogenase accessory sulfurtransferase FdhD [Methanosarcinales archaeon]